MLSVTYKAMNALSNFCHRARCCLLEVYNETGTAAGLKTGRRMKPRAATLCPTTWPKHFPGRAEGKPPTCHPRTCSAPIKALFKTVMSAVKRENATVEMMGIGHGGWFSTW